MQKPQKWPRRIFRNLPNKCGEGKSRARVKGPRWTEQRLQYILFRVHYITPPVTSRGIPELLNHCGPLGKEGKMGGALRRGGGPRPAQTPPLERTWVHAAAAPATAQATACTAQRRVTRLPDISGVSQLGNNPDGFRQDHAGDPDKSSPARSACTVRKSKVWGVSKRGDSRMLKEVEERL